MANDRTEAAKRGQHRKAVTKHPFIAIEHRIFDSPAFAALKPNAKVALFALARQLRKDNNGHLHATASWLKRYGIGSEHTVKGAVAQLIAHGLIYRTRSHGANGQWASYALTWLPIPRKDGLFVAGFVANAWRDWVPPEKKTSPQKLQEDTRKKCSFTPESPAVSAGTHPAETADYESLLPCTDSEAAANDTKLVFGFGQGDSIRKDRPRRPLTSPHCIRLVINNDRGAMRLAA